MFFSVFQWRTYLIVLNCRGSFFISVIHKAFTWPVILHGSAAMVAPR